MITKFKDFLLENNNNDIIAYHGSNNRFKKFDDNKPIFFVDNYNIAKTYGEFVYKVKLEINNPVVFDFHDKSTYLFNGKWYIPSELAIYMKNISDDLKNMYSIDDDLKDELEYHDFEDVYGDLDGIIMKNIKDANDGMFSTFESATNYVVFNNEQIKIIK